MFTGIIKELGKINRIKRTGSGMCLGIAIDAFDNSFNIGGSIAVNGVCLTATSFNKDGFTVDIVRDTLERTNLKALKINDIVNTELPLKLNERLNGHILEGHIDGLGKIIAMNRVGTQRQVKVRLPGELVKYVVTNGSIGVDGISLTVKDVKKDIFSVTLIPLSFEKTNLRTKHVGDSLNIEVDRIAKYVEKLLMERI